MSDEYRGERDRYEDGPTRRSQSPSAATAPDADAPREEQREEKYDTRNDERNDRNDRNDRGDNRGGDRGRDNRGGNEASNPGMNLHVSGLSPTVTAENLNEHFSTVGQVDKASVMYDPHTKESRGFGFVMMVDGDGAARAISELSGKDFMGKIMNVAHARRARARTPTPGRYFGPPKSEFDAAKPKDRYYEPRSYDNRYGGSRGGYDDRDRYERPARYDDRREPRYDDRRGGGYERGYDRGGYDYRSGGGGSGGGAGDYRGGSSGGGYRDERSYDPRSRY